MRQLNGNEKIDKYVNLPRELDIFGHEAMMNIWRQIKPVKD